MVSLANLMKQFADEIDVDSKALQPNKKGIYTIPIDEDLQISLSELEPAGVRFHIVLCPLPQEKKEAFYLHALLGNLFGQGTYGMTLGARSDGKDLTLSCNLDYNMSYKEFKEKLEDFMNAVDFWREEAESFGKEEEE